MSLRFAATVTLGVMLFVPLIASAAPFGGATGVVLPCFNAAIFAQVGPPRGGLYIWSPATRTYRFGAPRFSGQWLLGLYGAPYYCVVSIFPVTVFPGRHITMMGSSGPRASGLSTTPPANVSTSTGN